VLFAVKIVLLPSKTREEVPLTSLWVVPVAAEEELRRARYLPSELITDALSLLARRIYGLLCRLEGE